jgi:hypothetical protein
MKKDSIIYPYYTDILDNEIKGIPEECPKKYTDKEFKELEIKNGLPSPRKGRIERNKDFYIKRVMERLRYELWYL